MHVFWAGCSRGHLATRESRGTADSRTWRLRAFVASLCFVAAAAHVGVVWGDTRQATLPLGEFATEFVQGVLSGNWAFVYSSLDTRTKALAPSRGEFIGVMCNVDTDHQLWQSGPCGPVGSCGQENDFSLLLRKRLEEETVVNMTGQESIENPRLRLKVKVPPCEEPEPGRIDSLMCDRIIELTRALEDATIYYADGETPAVSWPLLARAAAAGLRDFKDSALEWCAYEDLTCTIREGTAIVDGEIVTRSAYTPQSLKLVVVFWNERDQRVGGKLDYRQFAEKPRDSTIRVTWSVADVPSEATTCEVLYKLSARPSGPQ